MWIIPKQLHTSDFVPDTAALSLDSTELSEICARSLFVRSKPSAARTWSAKWRRDSWTQHLSGRILSPSHGQSFVTAWTSSLGAIPASHSAQPVNDSAPMTPGTSGPTSQTEFDFFAPASASLKMSKDTSASDSERSLESWNKLVTKRRGEYSARVKSGRLTSASGFLSWPTVQASEEKANRYRDGSAKGTQIRLTTAVVKDAANWPTPDASNHRDGDVLRKDNNLEQGGFHGVSLHHAMTKYGQAAPANWSTPNTMDTLPPKSPEGIQRVLTHDGRKNRKSTGNLREDVVQFGLPAPANPSTDGSRQGLWPTITAHTPDMESSGPNGNSGTYLAGAVKAEENWVTPRTSGTSTRPNKTTPRQGLTLIEQAREQEKMWRTPSVAEEKNQNTSTQIYLQNQVGATPKAWATPQASDHIEGARTELTSNQKCLGRDMKEWGTPTARDHKSGRGNEEREYKELTPMVERTQSGKLNPRWVETLMGLPIGWTMPSCKSPVTIALTNFACSETESCQPQPSELLES